MLLRRSACRRQPEPPNTTCVRQAFLGLWHQAASGFSFVTEVNRGALWGKRGTGKGALASSDQLLVQFQSRSLCPTMRHISISTSARSWPRSLHEAGLSKVLAIYLRKACAVPVREDLQGMSCPLPARLSPARAGMAVPGIL